MKKYAFILWAALAMAGSFTACTNEDTPMSEQTTVKPVTIRATIDGGLGSRVALEDDVDNQKVKVDWKQGDDFKITVNGSDYTFTYTANNTFECSDTNFPATFTSAGTVTATYPATTPMGYANQLGTLDGAAALLTMTATLDVESGESTGNLNLIFKHNNSIVKMTLSNDAFKSKDVTGITLKSGSTAVATATTTFTGDADNGSIVAYFAVEPQAVTNISIVAVCEYKHYTATLTDNTLTEGTLYNVTKDMTEVTPMGDVTAANAVKGDFAMKDGSFIAYSEDITLTDEQKANVAGIVFWTENEDDGPSTLVGDEVVDKVMQSDFPNCTHGLIVSLTDVSTSCAWQGIYENREQKYSESIYNTFQRNHDTYKDYVAIRSLTLSDDNINKILGYNNTKVLEAYNAYCKENSKSDYLVKPIEALATWKESTLDIANTTGWFLPSCKELHMLCYKDVANICNSNAYGTDKIDTKNVVNASLEKVGGTQFGNYYWSSTESSTNEYYVFYVPFTNAQVNNNAKGYPNYYVRAVCAF